MQCCQISVSILPNLRILNSQQNTPAGFHQHEVKRAGRCREWPEGAGGTCPVLFLPLGWLHNCAHFVRIHWAVPSWYVPFSVSVLYFQRSLVFSDHGTRKSDSMSNTTLPSPVCQCEAPAISLWGIILATEQFGTASLLFSVLGRARSYIRGRKVMSQGT